MRVLLYVVCIHALTFLIIPYFLSLLIGARFNLSYVALSIVLKRKTHYPRSIFLSTWTMTELFTWLLIWEYCEVSLLLLFVLHKNRHKNYTGIEDMSPDYNIIICILCTQRITTRDGYDNKWAISYLTYIVKLVLVNLSWCLFGITFLGV